MADVFVYNRKLRNRLTKIAETNENCKVLSSDDDCAEFLVPKSWVKINPPKNMSAESLQRMSELGKQRMRELHNKDN